MKFEPGNLNGRDHLEDINVDGRRILKWKGLTGFIWLRIRNAVMILRVP
jgi:hypothetical protein